MTLVDTNLAHVSAWKHVEVRVEEWRRVVMRDDTIETFSGASGCVGGLMETIFRT